MSVVASNYWSGGPYIANHWITPILLGSLYAVDVFFWMGGFFLAYVMTDPKTIEHIKKTKINSIFSFILGTVHRLVI